MSHLKVMQILYRSFLKSEECEGALLHIGLSYILVQTIRI